MQPFLRFNRRARRTPGLRARWHPGSGDVRVGQLALSVGGALGLGETDRLNHPSGVGLPDRQGDVRERRSPRAEVVDDDYHAGLASDGKSQVHSVHGGVPLGRGGDAGEVGMRILGDDTRAPLPSTGPCKRARQSRRRRVVVHNHVT